MWKPIETAPKDGTRVLIYMPGLNDVLSAKFEHGTWQHGYWSSRPMAVTHWQPLPEPPKPVIQTADVEAQEASNFEAHFKERDGDAK